MAKNPKAAAQGARGAAKQSPPASVPARKSTGSKPSGESMPGLEVISNRDGYRRGGCAWTKKPSIVAAKDLTEEQFNQIVTDPNLTVTEVVIGGAGTEASVDQAAGAAGGPGADPVKDGE